MRCRMPNCRHNHTTSWALVPVCKEHYEAIKSETYKYYRKTIKARDRVHYSAIKSKTPWG